MENKKTNTNSNKKNEMLEEIRLNKFLSLYKEMSRREADRLVEEGRVEINGRVAASGEKVLAKDKVYLDGKLVRREKPKFIYIVFYKPKGIISSTSDSQGEDVVSYLNLKERVFPVGRLDRDSEGLLLMTNDGSIVNKIAKSKFGHDKEYYVKVNKDITPDFIKQMAEGVHILGRKTLPAKCRQVDKRSFKLTIQQGLNRQIRRMCEALGYEVTYLKRTRLMHITLGNLQPGEYRIMKAKEIQELHNLLDSAERKSERK